MEKGIIDNKYENYRIVEVNKNLISEVSKKGLSTI